MSRATAGEAGLLTAAVVICTSDRRRIELLRGCIDALLAGDRAPDELYVVVDTNPDLESELTTTLPAHVCVLRSERLGLSEARNVGIAAAKGNIVAFVDDDAAPDPGWLAAVLAAFARDELTLAVGGAVIPRWATDRRWMPDDLLWMVGCTYAGHRQDSGPIRNPIGCNMAVRRHVLTALGGFASGFGKRGNALATCDETELGLRLERIHGPGRICYLPDACVEHFVPAARISWRLLVRRSLSEGIAKGRLHRLYRGHALGTERTYARALITKRVPRLLLDSVSRRDRTAAMSALAIGSSLIITSVGFVSGALREMCLPIPGRNHLRRRLVDHLRLPLHRDSYALVLNSTFTAATGLLYWVLAATSYSAHAVGVNSALISTMMFLAGVASLNLPNILVRFLPQSGNRTRARVTFAYAAASGLALCAALVFVANVHLLAPRLGFLHSEGGLQAWFVLSTIAWCLFVIQDSVLTALGRAVWVPVENAIFSLLKLGLLAGLGVLLPVYGIFVSWTIGMLLSVLAVNFFIYARLIRAVAPRPGGHPLSVRDRAFARYFAADYVCSVAWLSTTNLMPVIVTSVVGATTNAYWTLAYAAALPLYEFAQSVGTSLMLHGTIARGELPGLARKAAMQGARLLVPAVAIVVLLAPQLLSLFGASYSDRGATALRLLALGALPNFAVVLAVHVSRVQRRLRRAVVALCTQAVLALGLAAPLLHALSVTGAGIAWFAAQCVAAGGILLSWRRSVSHPAARESPAANGPVAASHPTADPSPSTHVPAVTENGCGPDSREIHPILRKLFEDLEENEVDWLLLRRPASLAAPTGDVDLLVAPRDVAAMRRCANDVGFVALPGWETAPNLLLACYDQPSDRWLLLDVTTRVSFRTHRTPRLSGAVRLVLRRRHVFGGVALPADGDAFWLLLLHCLLDKRAVAAHHRPRLTQLAASAMDSPLYEPLRATSDDCVSPEVLVACARAGNWAELIELGPQLGAQLAGCRSPVERLRMVARAVVRAARKPLLLPRRRGGNVALLGPNGVGKSTAAAELARSLPFDARVVYMGIWKADSGARGRISIAREILTRPLRIWRRYATAQYHQLRGRFVLFDRYVYEALLPAKPPFVLIKRPYFWLLAHAVPAPSVVVVLDAPGSVTHARKQENSPDELEHERQIYAQMRHRVPALSLVDARADAATVRAEISAIVWNVLANRWRRAGAGGG